MPDTVPPNRSVHDCGQADRAIRQPADSSRPTPPGLQPAVLLRISTFARDQATATTAGMAFAAIPPTDTPPRPRLHRPRRSGDNDMVLHDMANEMRRNPDDAAANLLRLHRAMLDPETLYAAPSDVLLDYHLPRQDKIALLRNWKSGLQQRSMARDEGMVGGEEVLSQAITTVSCALERLQKR